MSQSDGIAWTDATWNPVGGCSVVSPGCTNCYAMRLAGTRLRNHPLYRGTTDESKAGPVFNGTLTIATDGANVWTFPRIWKGSSTPRLGAREDFDPRPSLIFVDDMADLFHEDRPVEHIDRVFEAMVAAWTAGGRSHIFQLLTKRSAVMARYFHDLFSPRGLAESPYRERLWLGFSAERQQEFDERWPFMRELAAMDFTVFVSYEPALGPLVLPPDFLALESRAWVILGGESGRGARSAELDWFRDVLSQCQHVHVPCFVKQLGSRPLAGGLPIPPSMLFNSKGSDLNDLPPDLRVRQFPECR